MTPCVVDTDVVSFLFENDHRAHPYLPLLRDRELLVSFMTEAELARKSHKPIGKRPPFMA